MQPKIDKITSDICNWYIISSHSGSIERYPPAAVRKPPAGFETPVGQVPGLSTPSRRVRMAVLVQQAGDAVVIADVEQRGVGPLTGGLEGIV